MSPILKGTRRFVVVDKRTPRRVLRTLCRPAGVISNAFSHHIRCTVTPVPGNQAKHWRSRCLGATIHQDVTLEALWRAVGIGESHPEATQVAFEYALAQSDLQEEPRVTTLDFLATTTREVAVLECKWSERGFGSCSCLKDGDGSPEPGNSCASRVDARRGYWRTAYRDFGLPPARTRSSFCPMSVAYQPIRNVAATRLLSAGRRGVFVLLYDDANPYFRQTGKWPGWPVLLNATLKASPDLIFKAISWQSLMSALPIPADVRQWAVEKHRLCGGDGVSGGCC